MKKEINIKKLKQHISERIKILKEINNAEFQSGIYELEILMENLKKYEKLK